MRTDSGLVSTAPSESFRPDPVGALGRWLIFLSGLTILVASLLLPAQADLRATRIERDRTLHTERAREQRNERYRAFLNDLINPDPQTAELLAMSQLGMIPKGRTALLPEGQPEDTMLLQSIDPVGAPFTPQARGATRLERLTTSGRWRLWIVAAGALALLYGLLPATKN